MTQPFPEDVRATVAATMRTVAEWFVDSDDRETLYQTAEQVLVMQPDDACCAVCEEVVCDTGCPLEAFRSDSRTVTPESGLEQRYFVKKVNDPTGKHDNCRYFVLDPQHDPIALEVLAFYIDFARRDGHEALADDLAAWYIDMRVDQRFPRNRDGGDQS